MCGFGTIGLKHSWEREQDPDLKGSQLRRGSKERWTGRVCPLLGLNKQAGRKKPDIVIKGEGVSEFAMRHGSLIRMKPRLEIIAPGNGGHRHDGQGIGI